MHYSLAGASREAGDELFANLRLQELTTVTESLVQAKVTIKKLGTLFCSRMVYRRFSNQQLYTFWVSKIYHIMVEDLRIVMKG